MVRIIVIIALFSSCAHKKEVCEPCPVCIETTTLDQDPNPTYIVTVDKDEACKESVSYQAKSTELGECQAKLHKKRKKK